MASSSSTDSTPPQLRPSTLVSPRWRYRSRKYEGYGESIDNAIVLTDDEDLVPVLTFHPYADMQETGRSTTEALSQDLVDVRCTILSEAQTT